MMPEYMNRFLKYVGNTQPYQLRNNDQFRLPRFASSFAQNSIFYKGAQMYNTMKSKINVSSDFNVFKKELCNHIRQTPIQ